MAMHLSFRLSCPILDLSKTQMVIIIVLSYLVEFIDHLSAETVPQL